GLLKKLLPVFGQLDALAYWHTLPVVLHEAFRLIAAGITSDDNAYPLGLHEYAHEAVGVVGFVIFLGQCACLGEFPEVVIILRGIAGVLLYQRGWHFHVVVDVFPDIVFAPAVAGNRFRYCRPQHEQWEDLAMTDAGVRAVMKELTYRLADNLHV